MNVSAAAAVGAAVTVGACSPGSLPGSPSPILTGGGGGRYSGTIAYRRVAGSFAIDESAQSLTMSIVLSAEDQLAAEFDSTGGSRGSLAGRVTGALNDGTFLATLIISMPAETPAGALIGLTANVFRPRAAVTCAGRGEATGRLSGAEVTWTIDRITYDNCAGLVTSLDARANALSPIPQPAARASVVLTVLPGTSVPRGRCENGEDGFPFTVEVAERSGIGFTFDDTIVVEERRAGQVTSTRRLDNPFTTLGAGERRRHSACSPFPGTYQAFFSGRDARGNALRFASPIVTFGS